MRRKKSQSEEEKLKQELEDIEKREFESELGYVDASEDEQKKRRSDKIELAKRKQEIIEILDGIYEQRERHASVWDYSESESSDEAVPDPPDWRDELRRGNEAWLNDNLERLKQLEISEEDELDVPELTTLPRFGKFMRMNLPYYKEQATQRIDKYRNMMEVASKGLHHLAEWRLRCQIESYESGVESCEQVQWKNKFKIVMNSLNDLAEKRRGILKTVRCIRALELWVDQCEKRL